MLLDLLYDVNSKNEAIIEEINDAIINIGDASIDGILNKLKVLKRLKILKSTFCTHWFK